MPVGDADVESVLEFGQVEGLWFSLGLADFVLVQLELPLGAAHQLHDHVVVVQVHLLEFGL